MKKLFELHDYAENMKSRIDIFSVKGKENIWLEDVKCVKEMRIKELSWHEFKRIFWKKYLSEMYYDNKDELYEIKIGLMIDEEYMTKFLELLRHAPYLNDVKEKFRIFSS